MSKYNNFVGIKKLQTYICIRKKNYDKLQVCDCDIIFKKHDKINKEYLHKLITVLFYYSMYSVVQIFVKTNIFDCQRKGGLSPEAFACNVKYYCNGRVSSLTDVMLEYELVHYRQMREHSPGGEGALLQI